jgi:hypothetical protein
VRDITLALVIVTCLLVTAHLIALDIALYQFHEDLIRSGITPQPLPF